MRKAGGSDIVGNKYRIGKICFAKAAVVPLILAVLLGTADGMAAVTAAGASGELQSKGVIQCEQAVIDASDLQTVYSYITEKRKAVAGILLQLGTKFRQQSGKIVCDRDPDAPQGDMDISQLSWPVIAQAAADSQKVPDGLAVLNPENAVHIEGIEEYTDHYVTATADNISRGKAAWADGRLLLGNGADNDKAYQAGIRDGESGHVPEFLSPMFSIQGSDIEIRHIHIGNPEETEGISGCYQNSKETKVRKVICGATLYYMEPIWIPNPEEPEGGSWHGGYYTCPNHNGIYASPGQCTHEDTVVTAVWKHDVVCGLEDVVYARLAVHGTAVDGGVRLEAVLGQGEAYERFTWQSEDRLVWTDGDGNILGTGTELTVQAPGTYRCSINVSNEDIDNREAGTVVKITGLELRN